MEPVIDIHAHLGNICFPGGGELIRKEGIKKRRCLDVVSLSEFFLHRFPPGENYYGSWLHQKEVRSSLERNFIGSLENFLGSMEKAGISHSVSLPIAPNVSFADIQPVAAENPSIIPFTSVDFTRQYDVAAALKQDFERGAKGMKLHPILQRERLTSQRTFEAVEAFAPYNLPVLMHTGICHYYVDENDKKQREEPMHGDVADVLKLVKAFPGVNFILGHAALLQWNEVKSSARSMTNIWVDGTFRGIEGILELINDLGEERVLFGSDWPWGNRKPAIKIIQKACKGHYSLERKLLFENAAQLMQISTC